LPLHAGRWLIAAGNVGIRWTDAVPWHAMWLAEAGVWRLAAAFACTRADAVQLTATSTRTAARIVIANNL